MALTDLIGRTGKLSIEMNLLNDPDPMFVTLGLGAADPSTPVQADVDALVALVATHLAVMQTASYTIIGGRLLWNDGAGSGQPTHSFIAAPIAEIGNIVGNAVPPNTATLVKKATNDFGRGSSGRFYVPGLPEVEVEATGALTPAFRTNAQDAMDDLQAALPGQPLQWVPIVIHHGPAVNPGGAPHVDDHPVEPFGIVTSFQVQAFCATQRRRLR